MSKKIFFSAVIILALVAAFSGCSSLNAPSNPDGVSPTVSPTPAHAVNVAVIMQRMENGPVSGEQYVVYVADGNGATITTAAVSLIGPNGLIGTPATGGVLIFQDMSGTQNYVYNGEYAVSVTVSAVNYYGTFTNSGDVTVAADGSQVSWGFLADMAIIQIITPAMSMQTYFPSVSPFDVNATGIYSAGAGTYTISSTLVDTIPLTFLSGDVGGGAATQIMKMVQVVKL